MIIKSFVYCMLLVTMFVASAQKIRQGVDTVSYLEQPNRIEFTIEATDLEFTVINGQEDGLLVVKETNIRSTQGYGWALYKLDTALQIEWTKIVIVPFAYSFKGWDYSRGNYYLLFARVQFTADEFSIFEINSEDGDLQEHQISTVFPISLSHFEVINRTILLAGSVNFQPAILTFELDDPRPRVIPGIYNTNGDLLEIYVEDDLGVFSVAMIEKTLDKRFTVNIKTYTTENLMIQNNIVNAGDRRSIIDGAPTQFAGGFQYVAGAYSHKSPDYSRGLYLAKFINGMQQFIKYYNYADLTNFFGYMGSKRQQRISERISRRKEKGKKNKFSYRLLVHDIIQRDDEFLMIAEAYYPRYSNYQVSPFYGAPSASYATISGYKFTHAVVVAFDTRGNILWDHSFKIDDVLKPSLSETVQVVAQRDWVELHYLEANAIRTKVVVDNEVIEGDTYTPVRLSSSEDELAVKDPEVEGLECWYDKTLYAYGEQQIDIKNATRSKTRREVFYINKVYYNPDQPIN